MAAPVVEFDHVSKHFGNVQAVRDVSFMVQPGEVIAFLGPNGAGKTTAISLMLGLRKPSSGTVRFMGRNPDDQRARARAGVMLQESGVPQSLKVREIVNLFRHYYAAPLPTGEAIQRAGLAEKANTLVGNLSGGQRQRLYFALAICGDPEVVFLDEPSVALDVQGRHDFWEQVRDFVRSGRTIVLTTHYLEEADALADRVVVIDRGRVIADGTPAAIKSRVAGKKLSFETAEPLSEVDFRGLPTRGLECSGRQVTLRSSEPEAVLKALFASGVELRNLEVTGVGLEDAFLSLTHHEQGELGD